MDSGRRVLHGGAGPPGHERCGRDAGHTGFPADPPRLRGRLLDGQDRGHQRAVRRIREGHRLRDRCRANAAGGGFPRGAARESRRGLGGVFASRPSRAAERSLSVVVVREGRKLAPSARPGQFDRRERAVPGSARRVRRRARLRKGGRQACTHRSGVGVCGAGRPHWAALSLGRRV